MIVWTKLLNNQGKESDDLRFCQANDFIPKVVVWNVTSRCNLTCKHCYIDAGHKLEADELSKEQAQGLIDDLAGIGVKVLLFSGGEPLLRDDIFELSAYAASRGLKPVLSTNGTLITPKLAKKIKQSRFVYIGISLDGGPLTNDCFRGQKGAYKAALSGVKNCQAEGLKVGLRFTLNKDNFSDLDSIFELAEKESISRLCIYHLVYSGRADKLMNEDLTHSQRREALELIWQRTFDFYQRGVKTEILTVDNHADGVWIYLRLKKHDPRRAREVYELLKIQGGNSSGIRIGAVDNLGNIYPDQFWRNHRLGNIKTQAFSEVWCSQQNEFLQNLRNRASRLKGRCKRCQFKVLCNGNFRARAESFFGDLWAEDPACYLTDQEIGSENEIEQRIWGDH